MKEDARTPLRSERTCDAAEGDDHTECGFDFWRILRHWHRLLSPGAHAQPAEEYLAEPNKTVKANVTCLVREHSFKRS